MPAAPRLAGSSSKPARASTLAIGKEFHLPSKIQTAACELRIIAASTNVTNAQASAVTFRNVAAKAVFASIFAASRAEKNTIIASGFSKGAQALASTLKTIEYQAFVFVISSVLFVNILGNCSRFSNHRYFIYEHYTFCVMRHEYDTGGSCGLLPYDLAGLLVPIPAFCLTLTPQCGSLPYD